MFMVAKFLRKSKYFQTFAQKDFVSLFMGLFFGQNILKDFEMGQKSLPQQNVWQTFCCRAVQQNVWGGGISSSAAFFGTHANTCPRPFHHKHQPLRSAHST